MIYDPEAPKKNYPLLHTNFGTIQVPQIPDAFLSKLRPQIVPLLRNENPKYCKGCDLSYAYRGPTGREDYIDKMITYSIQTGDYPKNGLFRKVGIIQTYHKLGVLTHRTLAWADQEKYDSIDFGTNPNSAYSNMEKVIKGQASVPLFAASESEVLAQIPAEYMGKVKGYIVEHIASLDPDELEIQKPAFEQGYYAAVTSLFGN